MAVIIKHTYFTTVEISFMGDDQYTFRQRTSGSMDDIAEHVCEMFIAHKFNAADVMDADTGEIIMQVERT